MCITADDIRYVLVNDPVDSSHALVTLLKAVFLVLTFIMMPPVQAWQRPQCTSSGFEDAEKHRASWKMQRRWVSWVSAHALAKDAANSCKLGMYACKS